MNKDLYKLQRDLQKLYKRAYKVHSQISGILETQPFNEAGAPSEVRMEHHSHKNREHSTIPIGKHTLPPLPYPYHALEPYIDEQTMRLHHDKHHKSYVEGLNKAEIELKKSRDNSEYQLIKHWERELAFHGAGHYLHTIFWNVMSPKGGGVPSGEILKWIEISFGSFDQFKAQFSKAAAKVEGSGWAALIWSPRAHRLEILQFEKHQNLSQQDMVPILVLDVWEHAYYLKYQNDRAAYIDAWWNVVNWDYVNQRVVEAQNLIWPAY